MKRPKEKGRGMQEVQRQTTEQVIPDKTKTLHRKRKHKLKI